MVGGLKAPLYRAKTEPANTIIDDGIGKGRLTKRDDCEVWRYR